jgi:DNA-binding response OmpR family regulator
VEHQPKKRILIADDDEGIVDALQLFLEDEGYEVEIVTDGAHIQDFPDGLPDLLLLDIWLPGWNGRDICIVLKSQEATRHIPIILISANKDTKKVAIEAGADDFIAKPFDLDDLLDKIEEYV